MKRLSLLSTVFVAALVCLVVSTAVFGLATYWIIGNELNYHVQTYTISMTSDQPEGNIPLNTNITFTLTLLFGSNPVNAATVCLFDGATQLLSGTTDQSGQCILAYTVTEVRDYTFTPRYLASP